MHHLLRPLAFSLLGLPPLWGCSDPATEAPRTISHHPWSDEQELTQVLHKLLG